MIAVKVIYIQGQPQHMYGIDGTVQRQTTSQDFRMVQNIYFTSIAQPCYKRKRCMVTIMVAELRTPQAKLGLAIG